MLVEVDRRTRLPGPRIRGEARWHNHAVYINGKEARKSLGHRDKQLAIQHAYELLHALFANETTIEDESLTVGLLENLYRRPDSTRRAPENRRFECAQSGRERRRREERASTGDPLNPISGCGEDQVRQLVAFTRCYGRPRSI